MTEGGTRRMVAVPSSRLRSMEPPPGQQRILVTLGGYTPKGSTRWRARDDPGNTMILCVCVGGRGWFQLEGRRYTVTAGQVMTLPPRLPHSYGSDPDDPWTIWWAHLLVLGAPDFTPAWPPLSEVPNPFRIVGLVSDILNELETDITDASMLVASAAASYALSYLAAAPQLARDTSEPLDRARAYIREHVTEPLSVAELAALVNVSTSHFSALFRKRFGVSAIRYQTELRMSRARDLLDGSELTIAAIARHVGYSNPYYFSRQFSAIHHMTPRDFRKLPKG